MAIQPIALGVTSPNIDPVGAFQESQSARIAQNGAIQQQQQQAMQTIAEHALGVMGGRLDGPVDPNALNEWVGMLNESGSPQGKALAARLAQHPDLVPVLAKGSIDVLKAGQNQQQLDLAQKQFQLELDKYNSATTSADKWVDLTDPAQRAQHGIAPDDHGLYQVNTANGELKPLSGKGQTINVGGNNDIGTIPPGKMVTRDANGNITGMVDIPGGPTAQAAADKTAADKATTDIAAKNADIVTTDVGRTLEKIATDPQWTTGAGALMTGWQPGSDAKSVYGFIDTIKANASFDKLQQLRNASPTGGALGQVSDVEEKMLSSAIGTLDPTQERSVFEYNLKRVFNIYKDVVDGKGNGPRYDLEAKGAPLVGNPADKPGVPKNAEETKTLDGKTYYRVGADWFEAD